MRSGAGAKWVILLGLVVAACLASLPSAARAGKLHIGERCTTAREQIYLRHKLDCAHGKLRRASLKTQRQGEPLLLGRHGSLQPGYALEAFDKLVAPLPGVHARAGAVGSLYDASDVVAAVEAQRAHLTAKQRRALERALTPSGGVLVKTTASSTARAMGDLQGFQALALEARQRLAQHGFLVKHQLFLAFAPVPQGNALAFVAPGWLDNVPGHEHDCVIYLERSDVSGLSPAEQRLLMVSTVFRCAEYEFVSSRAATKGFPLWVFDGAGQWVRDTVGQEWNGFALPDDAWENWVQRPQLDLGQRAFDALGFFALLAQSNVDVFLRLHQVLEAAASGGDFSAYGAATAGVPSSFFDTWGPGFVRDPGLGPGWDLTGPGIPAATPPLHYPITYGSSFSSFVDPRGAEGVSLGLLADVVEIQSTAAHGRLRTSDGSEVPVHTELLCTVSGGCTCDKGTLNARQVSKGSAWLGWQGGGVSVTGTSIANECQKKGKDNPPPPSSERGVCHLLAGSGVANLIPGGGFVSIERPLCSYGVCEQHFSQGDQQACALGHGATLVVNTVRSAKEARDYVHRRFPNAEYHVPTLQSISIGADVARIGKVQHDPLSAGNVVVLAKGRKVAIYELVAAADPGSPNAPIRWRNRRETIRTVTRIAKQL